MTAQSTGISPLAVSFPVLGAIWLYRLWRPSRDRNLSSTYYTSILPVSMIWVAAILVFSPTQTPKWLVSIIWWFPMLVIAVLLMAGAIQRWRDRKADERQRAALNLAQRRRMLTETQLVVAWFVGGWVAMTVSAMAMAVTIVAVSGGRPVSRETTQMCVVVEMALLLSFFVAGWIHVSLRPTKIAREDERLRRLDLGLDDEA